jgi:hypothetical protein
MADKTTSSKIIEGPAVVAMLILKHLQEDRTIGQEQYRAISTWLI